nr:DUF86 domain-containing protein [Candidatus Sigynarchaeum springense]
MDKLDHLVKYHRFLSRWLAEPIGEPAEEDNYFRNHFSIYHSAQLLAEVISDVAAMIVKDLGHIVGDNYQNLEQLLNAGIIDRDETRMMNELNGLRNRIAHDYNGIIDKLALESIKKTKDVALAFYGKVEKWLSKH